MDLIPDKIKGKIPKLYETEVTDINSKLALVKLSAPGTYWNWYVVEYDGNDVCFGLIEGHDVEFGYFSIKELSEIKKPHQIVRDESFKPTEISKLLLQGLSERG